jgi:redox-sensing transcriptional repressor
MNARRRTPPETVSHLTINRLSIYLRCLQQLQDESVTTVSSQELADRFNLNSAQIRKDLAYFGEFGTRGVGYNATVLAYHLVDILGLGTDRAVLVMGAGNVGTALAHYSGFNSGGFKIVALLDSDDRKVGKKVPGGLIVESARELPKIVASRQVQIGVIAVPTEVAQTVFDEMVDAGVQAVLNFAPTQLKDHPEVRVKNVDLKINLELLSFYLVQAEQTR